MNKTSLVKFCRWGGGKEKEPPVLVSLVPKNIFKIIYFSMQFYGRDSFFGRFQRFMHSIYKLALFEIEVCLPFEISSQN